MSRLTGLIRTMVLARYLGQQDDADIWNTGFRIPNFLQNLFGEGALSASFIPAYSRLLHEGKEVEARRLAGALLSLISLVVAVVVLIGEIVAPWLVALLISDDWSDAKRAMTVHMVRIFFPGTGLLVVSAWCLGVLNSHRRFLLSYASPMVWNAAIIAAIVVAGMNGLPTDEIIVYGAWGAVLGSLLQVAVQWPMVWKVGGAIVPRAWQGIAELPYVIRAFIPSVITRGANQISAFIDLRIASWLPTGSVTAITNAQALYTLPVSLFGMAISAAELPEMSRATGNAEQIATTIRVRLSGSTQRLAYYIIPSAVGFLTLGGVIAAALLQRGRFVAADSTYVWYVLAGSAIGLLASTLGRLYASTFYALRDTKTPLYCGIVRVILTGVLGVLAVRTAQRVLGPDSPWCAAALTASAGMAGWVEFVLLREGLRKRIGRFDIPTSELAKLWSAAAMAGVTGTAAHLLLSGSQPFLIAAVACSVNAVTYLLMTSWWDIPEAAVLTDRMRRLAQRIRR